VVPPLTNIFNHVTIPHSTDIPDATLEESDVMFKAMLAGMDSDGQLWYGEGEDSDDDREGPESRDAAGGGETDVLERVLHEIGWKLRNLRDVDDWMMEVAFGRRASLSSSSEWDPPAAAEPEAGGGDDENVQDAQNE